MGKNKAIFLDRDGTINIDKGYLFKKEDFEFEENSIEALKRFIKLNFILIIVTNQSGIGRGYYTENDVEILNEYLIDYLLKKGIEIKKIYYCPHHPKEGTGNYKKECECRKPNPGMLLKGIKEFNIDISKSYMVGDKISDVIAGLKSGLKSVLLTNNKKVKKEILENFKEKIYIFEDLNEFSKEVDKI